MATAASVLGEGERSHGRVEPPNTQRKGKAMITEGIKKEEGKTVIVILAAQEKENLFYWDPFP